MFKVLKYEILMKQQWSSAYFSKNKSDNHVDFMFGTKDLKVIGIKDNIEEVIMENGNFIK